MYRLCIPFLLLLALGVGDALAQQADRIVWQQRPEQVQLSVGQETALIFPAPVEIKYPRTLGGRLEVTSLGRRVFIKPHGDFDATRIHAQTLGGGSYYLFDLSATDGSGAPAEIQIFDATAEPATELAYSDGPATPATEGWGTKIVPLIRFMASQFYGPERLTAQLPGARRITVDQTPIDLVPLRHQVLAIPQAGWHYRGLYGYAVKIANHSNSDYIVDPRDFRGAWVSATAQHSLLTAGASQTAQTRATHETIVYLTSTRPLRKVAQPSVHARVEAP